MSPKATALLACAVFPAVLGLAGCNAPPRLHRPSPPTRGSTSFEPSLCSTFHAAPGAEALRKEL